MTRPLRLVILGALLHVSTGCSEPVETPTSATTAATTFTLSNTITVNGTASRSFVTTASGAIELTLSSVVPEVPLGVGVGIPRADGGGCQLTRSAETVGGSGPHVTVDAVPGAYCVKVFDLGSISERVTFSAVVTHQ